MVDAGCRCTARIDSRRLVAKKEAASTAVVLVSALPALRPVMNPPEPPPPIPSAPPSERCNRTTPTRAIAIMIWIRRRTVLIVWLSFLQALSYPNQPGLG
jgi:hypothetical protein